MRQFLFVMEPNTQESGKLFKDTLYIRALGRNFYFCPLKEFFIQFRDVAGLNSLILQFIQSLPISFCSFFHSVCNRPIATQRSSP